MSTDLDDILGDTEATPTPETAPQPETIGQPRDEEGKFVKAETEDTGEPVVEEQPAAEIPQDAPPASEPGHVPIAALKDERNKRQELERRLAELEQRTAAPPAGEQDEPDMPDPIEDPKGYHDWIVGEAERRIALRNISLSAKVASAKYDDFAEKMQVFQQLAAQNPSLNSRLFEEPDPAEYAYRVVKGHEAVSQYGDIDKLLEAKRKEWEQEALASVAKPPASAPTTIANERSVGARSGPGWTGPKSLSELLT